MKKYKVNKFGLIVTLVLTTIFVILKMFKVINWSTIWVLSPIWIVLGIDLIIVIYFFIYTFICIFIQNYKYHKERKALMNAQRKENNGEK